MYLRFLSNELWKLFGKKRTYMGFAVFVLAQNAMLFAFHFSKWEVQVQRLLESNGHVGSEFISALTVSVVMLIPQALLLMPLFTTLVGGDIVAKEVEDGTMRMILSRPVTRLELLAAKWTAGAVFCVLLAFALGASALVFALCWFPWKGMFVFVPDFVFGVLDSKTGFELYLGSQILCAVNAVTMFSLAFMFSCLNVKPAAATIIALSFLFFSLVMHELPFFGDYQHWFLPHHFRNWILTYSQPTPWPRIAESLFILFGYNASTFIIGSAVFQSRDFKS